MSGRVTVSVVGLGVMGALHVRALREIPQVELISVCDISESARDTVASAIGVSAFEDVESLLRAGTPDLAIVAVPTGHHRVVAEQLVDAGVPVLIEKPLVNSVDDGLALIQRSIARGVPIGVGHIERFNPVITTLQTQLESRALGVLFNYEARRIGPLPPRIRDVGVVLDLSSHDLDVVTHLHSARVVRIQAETHCRYNDVHEEFATALLRFDDGVVATIHANWLSPVKIRDISVTGERGMLVADYMTQELNLIRRPSTLGDWPDIQSTRPIVESIAVKRDEPLRLELEACLSSVRTGSTFPVTGADGLRIVRLAEAIRRASAMAPVVGDEVG